MSRIEVGLHEHHARLQEQARDSQASAAAGQGLTPGTSVPTALEAPFAKVNSVVAGSPAESAGLQVGDSITKFGWVDWTNHDKLGRVAEVVSQNEGVSCLPSQAARCWRAWKLRERGSAMHDMLAGHRCAALDAANRAQLPIIVKALRPSAAGGPAETVQVNLTPRRNWGGRGLLGCHLLPL